MQHVCSQSGQSFSCYCIFGSEGLHTVSKADAVYSYFRDFCPSVIHYFSFFLVCFPAAQYSSSSFLSALSFRLPTRRLFLCGRGILPQCMPDPLSPPLVICFATGCRCAHLHTSYVVTVEIAPKIY